MACPLSTINSREESAGTPSPASKLDHVACLAAEADSAEAAEAVFSCDLLPPPVPRTNHDQPEPEAVVDNTKSIIKVRAQEETRERPDKEEGDELPVAIDWKSHNASLMGRLYFWAQMGIVICNVVEDMMYYRTEFCSDAKPSCTSNLKFPLETRREEIF